MFLLVKILHWGFNIYLLKYYTQDSTFRAKNWNLQHSVFCHLPPAEKVLYGTESLKRGFPENSAVVLSTCLANWWTFASFLRNSLPGHTSFFKDNGRHWTQGLMIMSYSPSLDYEKNRKKSHFTIRYYFKKENKAKELFKQTELSFISESQDSIQSAHCLLAHLLYICMDHL